MGLAHRLAEGGLQRRGIETKTGGEGLAQGLADPDIELQGQIVGQLRPSHQGRAQRRHPARGLHQQGHVLRSQRRLDIAGERREDGGLALLQDGRDHRGREPRAAGHLDLMLDGGLDQQADQILVVQQGAGGDDGAGDLDVVEGQDIDQGGRRPVHMGQLLGQAAADIPFGLDHQAHEDRIEQILHRWRGHDLGAFGHVTQFHDRQQQSLPVRGRSTPGQAEDLFRPREHAQGDLQVLGSLRGI